MRPAWICEPLRLDTLLPETDDNISHGSMTMSGSIPVRKCCCIDTLVLVGGVASHPLSGANAPCASSSALAGSSSLLPHAVKDGTPLKRLSSRGRRSRTRRREHPILAAEAPLPVWYDGQLPARRRPCGARPGAWLAGIKMQLRCRATLGELPLRRYGGFLGAGEVVCVETSLPRGKVNALRAIVRICEEDLSPREASRGRGKVAGRLRRARST